MKKNYVLISRVLAAAVMLAAAVSEKTFAANPLELPEVGGLLNLFRFDDTNWMSYRGYPPRSFDGIQLAPSWDTNAVRLTGPGPAYLSYNCVETNWTNISCSRGVIWMWFRPQWNSGTGPGTSARLFEIGAFSTEQTNWFAFHFNSTGDRLYFSGHSNGLGGVYLESPPLQLVSNQWTSLALTYTITNSALYTNGVLATNGNGVLYPPGDSFLNTSTFYLGSDSSGSNVVNGDLEWVRIYQGLLPESMFLTHYNFGLGKIQEYEGGEGDGLMGPDGFALDDGGDPVEPQDGGSGEGGAQSGLRLSTPEWLGTNFVSAILGGEEGFLYDFFRTTNFIGNSGTNSFWSWAGEGTNNGSYLLPFVSSRHAYYILGSWEDTDFDGLSDAFETLVFRTKTNSADSDLDAVMDGDEDSDGDGIPNFAEYVGITRAVIYTTKATALEGGTNGEVVIRLPFPAPTNNTIVTLHHGGTAEHENDYRLLKTDGSPITNDVFFAAGATQMTLRIEAINDIQQASGPRKVSLALAESPNYQLDYRRADVTLIENDLPLVSVVATDSRATEPSTNDTGVFLLRREGSNDLALTVKFSYSGTATTNADFTASNSPVTFPAGSNTVAIPVTPVHDTDYEGDETVRLTLQADPAYAIDSQASNATVNLIDNDLPVVSFVGTDLVATEYGLTTATVTLRRTGNTSKALTVPIAIAGTATNGTDYQTLTNIFTFASNATDVAITVTPLSDSFEEQSETVILTIKGSLFYTSGSSNSVAVVIDDDKPTRYEAVQIKYASVYKTTPPTIDSPMIMEVRRFGRSDAAVNIPFQVWTNSGSGPQQTTYYRAYGDVSGANAALPAYASKAVLKFTAPVGGASGAVNVRMTNINFNEYAVWFRPAHEYVQFQVVNTNAIEGTSTQALVRLSRPVVGPAVSLPITASGNATIGSDHNLSSSFIMTIPNNAPSADVSMSATLDALPEGWETVIFTPDQDEILTTIDPATPRMAFIRENVSNTTGLAEYDTDLDGLSDRFEAANNFDPFNPAEAQLDADKDGLTNLEECDFGMNPWNQDTDGDQRNDFLEAYGPIDYQPGEYVEVRFRVGDTGKVNNGMNCAVCHTTQLKVGDYSYFSAYHGLEQEKTFFFRRGSNYNMFLSELVKNLPPATGNSANPTTTAKYTAAVLAPTNSPRAFTFTDPNNKLGTNKPWVGNFPTDPSVSIGTLTAPKIDLIWTNMSGYAAIDTNSNIGGGFRIFPDHLNPTDFPARNYIRLKVKTTPPLPNQVVRLKSFDVDDPYQHPRGDPGFLIDTNDMNGPRGVDNRGWPPQAGQLDDTLLTLDANGEKLTTFGVTFQPGDNFRVAAILDTPGAITNLDALQVTNEAAPMYVPPSQDQVRGFVGAISPMLTVWRKLHLEFDSMVAPPTSGTEVNFVSGTIGSVSPNVPAPGASQVRIIHSRFDGPGLALFERGRLEVSGVGTFRATNSSTLGKAFGGDATILDLDTNAPASIAGLPFKLYDDDDQYLTNNILYPSVLALQFPPLPMDQRSAEFITNMQPRFADAYIQLFDVNATNWNTQRTIPFKRHAPSGSPGLGGLVSVFDDALQMPSADRSAFWAFSVAFGYQPEFLEDGEPNSEEATGGETIKLKPDFITYGFSVVWVESIRERTFSPLPTTGFANSNQTALLQRRYLEDLYTVIAHEIGHAPDRQSGEGDHGELGIMEEGAPVGIFNRHGLFSPATIARFRRAQNWGH